MNLHPCAEKIIHIYKRHAKVGHYNEENTHGDIKFPRQKYICLKVVITQSDNYNEGSCVGEFEGLDVSTPTLGSSSGELEAYGERQLAQKVYLYSTFRKPRRSRFRFNSSSF